MRSEDIFEAIGKVEDERLACCETRRNSSTVIGWEESKMNNSAGKTRRVSVRKLWPIAAVIAVMVCMLGCAWAVLTIAESPLFDYPLTDSSSVAPGNIQLSVSEVTPTSMRVHCTIRGVKPGKDAIYILRGGPFTLEKKTATGWENLPAFTEDPVWDADEILTDGSTDWIADWSMHYGILEKGTYRFTATVLEGNAPASVEFTLTDEHTSGSAGELAQTLRTLLSGECYYVRYSLVNEFGSFENLTKEQRAYLEGESKAPVEYEFLKCGEDVAVLSYRGDRLWDGMMYRNGRKYRLDHENDDRTCPVIGWSLWPDMDLNSLTWWVGSLMDPEKDWTLQYAPDCTLTGATLSTYSQRYQNSYDVEVNTVQTFTFLGAEEGQIAAKLAQQNVDAPREFSWEEDQRNRKALDVTFVNTAAQSISTATEAAERAMAECTAEYDKIVVYRDEAAGMWKVEFQIAYGYQGYRFIYLDDAGITRMVSGAGSKVEQWQDLYPDP